MTNIYFYLLGIYNRKILTANFYKYMDHTVIINSENITVKNFNPQMRVMFMLTVYLAIKNSNGIKF